MLLERQVLRGLKDPLVKQATLSPVRRVLMEVRAMLELSASLVRMALKDLLVRREVTAHRLKAVRGQRVFRDCQEMPPRTDRLEIQDQKETQDHKAHLPRIAQPALKDSRVQLDLEARLERKDKRAPRETLEPRVHKVQLA